MDLGESLNPALDIGQIEGGFVQGCGFLLTEELLWDTNKSSPLHGHMLTANLKTYSIPSTKCIPIDFRISLLKDAANPEAVHSSKAVGEPPLCLAASVFFAIKNAIYSARAELNDPILARAFPFDAPATPENIRMACKDKLTNFT